MKLDWIWGAMSVAVGAGEERAMVRVQGALNAGDRLSPPFLALWNVCLPSLSLRVWLSMRC